MRGYVLLEGGNEFKAGMARTDHRAMTLAGGPQAPVRIIPAAAAPDQNDVRAGENGVQWFKGLGATDVRSLPVIDRVSADRWDLAGELETARMVYLLGGFPRYLAETLAGSRVWEAIRKAHREGAVIGGSSAGAMVLCENYYNQPAAQVFSGLDLLAGCCVLPHHDTFGKGWARPLSRLLPKATLIGIDEETGMLNDGPSGEWTVYGRGAVTVYAADGLAIYHSGHRFDLPERLPTAPDFRY
jgi:cyanophycinase